MKHLVNRLWPRFGPDQYVLYFLGCLLFSVGANFFIASKLGTDPLDVFSLGLIRQLPLTVGIAQGGFAAACLGVWALWNRRLPIVSPFFTFFFCGSLIDIWMRTDLASYFSLTAGQMLMAGVSLCAYGSALIIMSGIGIRAMDLVAITMAHKWRIPFWACKGTLEMLLLMSGWLLGGPVGIGTIWFLGVVGWLIQPLMSANGQLLKLPNYGLAHDGRKPLSSSFAVLRTRETIR